MQDAAGRCGTHNLSTSPSAGPTSPFPPQLRAHIQHQAPGQLHDPGDAPKHRTPGATIPRKQQMNHWSSLCVLSRAKGSIGGGKEKEKKKKKEKKSSGASKRHKQRCTRQLESKAWIRCSRCLKRDLALKQKQNQSCRHFLRQPRACTAKALYQWFVRSH